jgi:hypothetical protein
MEMVQAATWDLKLGYRGLENHLPWTDRINIIPLV